MTVWVQVSLSGYCEQIRLLEAFAKELWIPPHSRAILSVSKQHFALHDPDKALTKKILIYSRSRLFSLASLCFVLCGEEKVKSVAFRFLFLSLSSIAYGTFVSVWNVSLMYKNFNENFTSTGTLFIISYKWDCIIYYDIYYDMNYNFYCHIELLQLIVLKRYVIRQFYL